MSKQTKYDQFLQVYQTFRNQKPEEFLTAPATHNEFDGPNVAESRETMKVVLHELDGLRLQEVVDQLSWHTFNSLVGVMQSVSNNYAQYIAARDQSSFQSFATSLDSLSFHLRMYGAVALVNGEARTEKQLLQLADDMAHLQTTSREIQSLRDQVRELITPAVAGSLSKAFTDRKISLFRNRIFWLIILICTASISIYATSRFGEIVADALLTKNAAGAAPLWFSALMRAVFLLPLYATVGFSFAQYRKERDFEEQYAHKAALAISLPNYGDLAKGDAVKDQIVTGATSVVFAPPVAQAVNDPGATKTLGSVKEILEALNSLISKKT